MVSCMRVSFSWLMDRLQAQEAELRYMVTAAQPPHPHAVRKWLKDLQAAYNARGRTDKESTSSFGMDPNTGKLLVRDSASQDSGGSARDSDLLGTPAFASPPVGPLSTRLRGRSRLGASSQVLLTQADTEVPIWPKFPVPV